MGIRHGHFGNASPSLWILVGGWTNPIWKIWSSKLGVHLPQGFGVKISKKYLKPPPPTRQQLQCFKKIPSRPSRGVKTPPAPAALPPPNWGGPRAPWKKISGRVRSLRVSDMLCLDFGMFQLLSFVGNENKLICFLIIDSEKWKLMHIIYSFTI